MLQVALNLLVATWITECLWFYSKIVSFAVDAFWADVAFDGDDFE